MSRDFTLYSETSDFIFNSGTLSTETFSPNQQISAEITLIKNHKAYIMENFTVIFRGYAQSFSALETGMRSDMVTSSSLPLVSVHQSVDSSKAGLIELFRPLCVNVTPMDSKSARFNLLIPNKYLPSHAVNKHGVIEYELIAIYKPLSLRSEPRKVKFQGGAPIPLICVPNEVIERTEKWDQYGISITGSILSGDSVILFSSPNSSDAWKLPFKLTFIPEQVTISEKRSLQVKLEVEVLYRGRFIGHPDYIKVVSNLSVNHEISRTEPTVIQSYVKVYPTSLAISGPITIPHSHYNFDKPTFTSAYDPTCTEPFFSNWFELNIVVTKLNSKSFGGFGKIGKDPVRYKMSFPLFINMTSRGPSN
ncbi:hypothetical protein HK098_008225 [Nowakowskiella sp. JEL0407]|nr:hypothetical protein HK098_008225 [Nowakowskiella sp. JEL0407]